ncbi:MAG: four helix bundle protein [Patescibacteria group bacterium]
MAGQFHDKLKSKMDEFAHLVYRISRDFPKDELYGVTSQIRRASLSIILNYIEGYARQRSKVYKNFLEISYGSLQETKYLLHFSLKEKYLNNEDFQESIKLAEEIGAMLWGLSKKI